MNAELITIGDEILIGQIVDTNSQWISKELNKIGVSVYQITSIQDNKYHIEKALTEALKNTDIVILTGGLGPTNDDITKNTLMEYFDDTLVFNEEVEANVKALFQRINYPFTEVNRQQAFVPSKCTVLMNHRGTAPGMWFNYKGNIVVSLPGVPREMKGLMKDGVIPGLKKALSLPSIYHQTVITYGMGESMVAERLEQWESDLPEDIKLAYLPAYGKLRLRLSAKGKNYESLQSKVQEQIKKLPNLIGDIVASYDNESIEEVIGRNLQEQGHTLSTAESCTGGAIAKKITAIPGASNYFKGTVVTYSTDSKINVLGLSSHLLEENNPVSEQVTAQMVLKVAALYQSDYAIAITGNAGPSLQNESEDQGVAFISILSPRGTSTERFTFGKGRIKVIERASNKALELLWKEILKN